MLCTGFNRFLNLFVIVLCLFFFLSYVVSKTSTCSPNQQLKKYTQNGECKLFPIFSYHCSILCARVLLVVFNIVCLQLTLVSAVGVYRLFVLVSFNFFVGCGILVRQGFLYFKL